MGEYHMSKPEVVEARIFQQRTTKSLVQQIPIDQIDQPSKSIASHHHTGPGLVACCSLPFAGRCSAVS